MKKAIVVLTGAAIALVAGFVVKVVILKILWGWFVAPVFSLPELSVIHAVGIVLIVALLTDQQGSELKDRDCTVARLGRFKFRFSFSQWINDSLILPLLFLVGGWVVHLFV